MIRFVVRWTLIVIVPLALPWLLAHVSRGHARANSNTNSQLRNDLPAASFDEPGFNSSPYAKPDASPSVTHQPPPAASLDPTAITGGSGPALMNQVVESIRQHRSVSAKIRHRADLFGQKLVGSGVYLQQHSDRGLQVRFALRAKSNDRPVSLLHVGDGRLLWMNDNLDGRVRLTRNDLARLRRESNGANDRLPLMLGGGLPTLLANLQANFVIAPPQSVIFQDVPMWALALRWNPKRIGELMSGVDVLDEQGRARTDQLPSQFPDRVFLLVGQDDLFPYHIDYRRTESEEGRQSLEKHAPSRSIATMELFQVRFNAPIDPVQFVYRPPANIGVQDLTEANLAKLKRRSANGQSIRRTNRR